MVETLFRRFPLFRFVDYLEQRIPEGDSRGMSQVFDSLVQRFLTVERYSDDIRYVKYCIKCVSLVEMLHYCVQRVHELVCRTINIYCLLSCRQAFTRTPLPCTPMSTVKELAAGPLPST